MAGYAILDEAVSSSSGKTYQIRRGGDGVVYCHCKSEGKICWAWLRSKNRGDRTPACKHTKAYLAETGAPAALFAPTAAAVPKAGKKVASAPTIASAPAGADWRSTLRAELERAAKKGLTTPAAALAEFRAEVGRFANLDVEEVEVVVPVRAGRALDVE